MFRWQESPCGGHADRQFSGCVHESRKFGGLNSNVHERKYKPSLRLFEVRQHEYELVEERRHDQPGAGTQYGEEGVLQRAPHGMCC